MSDLTKPRVLYDLSAIVKDDLERSAAALAEGLERSETDVLAAINGSRAAYERGEITQVEHWGRVALKLALEDVNLLQDFAIQDAEVDQKTLGKIRVQSPTSVLGLVSDAAPDFVGNFRRRYQLDELIQVHVIGSELDEKRDYKGLLKLAAERMQSAPAQVTYVGPKDVHCRLAQRLGFQLNS